MAWRIHTVGASGSGTTTLAAALSARMNIPHFDADDYFWENTDPPYTLKRPVERRLALLKKDLYRQTSWILSGSIVNWGDSLKPDFTHVAYLHLPPAIRIERLKKREQAKFGARIAVGGDMHQQHLDSLEWASRYDDGALDVRSKLLHDDWLRSLPCPVIRISGELDTEAQARVVSQALASQ